MSRRTITVVHNNVDQRSSIGKLASWAVSVALDHGMHVNVVARDLDEALRDSVRWIPLYVPPRLHALQWAVAEPTVRKAMRGVQSDLMHVYQPQLSGIADTWHVEYLSRVAVETDSLAIGSGWRPRLDRAQARAVARMEDGYVRRRKNGAWVLWCSDYLRSEYERLYGKPLRGSVLNNPALDLDVTSDHPTRLERRGRPVLGYLGGTDPRKGFSEMLDAIRVNGHLDVVVAGPGSDGFYDPAIGDRMTVLGHVTDLTEFWSQIDVLVVPSRFDPFAMVVAEACARSKPVIVTPRVGASALVLQHGAGYVWNGDGVELGALASMCMDNYDALARGGRALAEDVSSEAQASRLVQVWSEILRE